VGTGPYRVTAAVSGESVTLNRFEDYNGDRAFHYDVLQLDVVEDPNARTSGLRSGQYDVIEDVPASSFENAQGDDALQAEAVPSYLATILFCHAGKPPFDDRRLRQALFYAIDRDTITATSFFGLATPAWASPLSPEHPEFVEADTVYRYDPDRARDLLAEAGHADGGIRVDFLVGNLEFLASQGPVIEQNLRDVGFEPNMIPGEVEALYTRVTDGDYNAFLAFTDPSGLGPADAEFLLRWLYYGAVPESFLFWDENAVQEIAQRLDEAFNADDESERGRLLAEAQNIIQDGAALLPMHFKQQLTGWSSALDGFHPLPTTGFNLEGVSTLDG
jgi:peptide/nickel transport system substrate-binding protein